MIIAKLSSVKINFDDEVQCLILLSSLPKSWSGLVTNVCVLAGKANLKFDEVRDMIFSKEVRRKESASTSGSALNTGNRGITYSRSNQIVVGRSGKRGMNPKIRARSSDGIVMIWSLQKQL